MFHRYFDAGLAQSSYLLACDRTRRAIVIDPRRDVDVYVTTAAQHQLDIVAAIETHVHADFVSGARELAAAGVQILSGPGSSLGFASREVQDRERIAVGEMSVRFLHTPGHTPEHISVLVENRGEPARVFTGDTLFAGAVGRPDLLGEAAMRRLAGALHDSLFQTLLMLDDGVEVHPGHGAGSLCGAGIGSEPFSTIGRERRSNPMLAHADRETFLAAVLADLPETPPYFARMKRVNQQGPAVLDLCKGYPPVRPVSAEAAARSMREGSVLIDLRHADAFCAAHAAASLHMAFGARVGYWAGWVLPEGSGVILMTDDPQQANEAARQLLRVGFDAVDGYVDGGFGSWRERGLPTSRITQVTPLQIHEHLQHHDDIVILDVRDRHEWAKGHLEKAVHVPVGDVVGRAREFASHAAIATICEGGYRSMLAASLLARAGLSPVLNITGGMSAYRSDVLMSTAG